MAVSIVRMTDTLESLRQAVALCNGFAGLNKHDRVVVKPNVSTGLKMPPYGMITTTSMLEALVRLLIEHGCSDISIAEGSIEILGVDTPRAYARTQIDKLAKRYGVKLVDLNRGPFRQVELDGLHARISRPALEADFLINVPVLKTHGLTKVSLGFKNLKGCLNPASRINFHRIDHLNHLIRLLNEVVRTHLTIIDGTYMLEMGPDTLLGRARRKDIVIASQDVFACDIVGSAILGIDPSEVGYLNEYADAHGRPLTIDAVQIEGEKDIDALREHLEWKPDVAKELLAPAGITGISVPHPGDTLCSRCYVNLGLALVAFAKDSPNTDGADVVICCGRHLKPGREGKKAILYGDCAARNHGRHDTDSIPVKGCPPRLWETLQVFHFLLLGKRRSLTAMPRALLRLAGAKIGVYDYKLPKWRVYDSGSFDRRDFEVSRQRRQADTGRLPTRRGLSGQPPKAKRRDIGAAQS